MNSFNADRLFWMVKSWVGFNSFRTFPRQGTICACRSKKSGTTCSLKWQTVTAVASLTINYIIYEIKYIAYALILQSQHNEFCYIFYVFLDHFKTSVGVTDVAQDFNSCLSFKFLCRKSKLLHELHDNRVHYLIRDGSRVTKDEVKS